MMLGQLTQEGGEEENRLTTGNLRNYPLTKTQLVYN